MAPLDTSRWRLGSVFALLACQGDPGDDESYGESEDYQDGPCVVDEDCDDEEYCDDGVCIEAYDGCQDNCHPECAEDWECGPDELCEDGYCESADAIAFEECRREHSLFPAVDGFLEVDGVVDLAFVDTQVVIAFPTRLDVVLGDVVVDSVSIGEDIGDIAAADIDADGDADLVVADRGLGGRLLVVVRDDDGSLVQTGELASPGVTAVELRERRSEMPDAVVRTDSGIAIHAALGEPTALVQGVIGALAVHGDAMIYAGDGTWWFDLAMPATSAVRLDERSAVAVGWGRVVDDSTDAIGAFADPGQLRVWQGPGELVLERDVEEAYMAFRTTDLVEDGIDDFVVLSTHRFLVVANRPTQPLACAWGVPAEGAMNRLLDLGDIDGDAIVDIAMSDGRTYAPWTLDSAVD
jgi:hypothetical protein